MQWLDSTLDLFCYCTHMPFRTGPLDAVTCSEVLEHIPDIKKATAEIARVLKPAGGTSCSRCLSSIPLHGDTEERCGDYWRLTPGNLGTILQKDYSLRRGETVNLFHSGDPFVVGIHMLWQRMPV